MATQSGTYDFKSQKAAHDDAATKATNYLTDVDSAGVFVHPSTDNTSGWKISNALELIKNSITYFKVWLTGNTPTVQIGKSDSGHVDIKPSEVDFKFDTYTPVKITARDYVGYINLDNDNIQITGAGIGGDPDAYENYLGLSVHGSNNNINGRLALTESGVDGYSSVDLSDAEVMLYVSGSGTGSHSSALEIWPFEMFWAIDGDESDQAFNITSSGTVTLKTPLPASSGGTGETTLNNSANALINALGTGSSNITDDDTYIITENANATEDKYYRRPVSKLWSYIKGKADAVYAAVGHTHDVATASAKGFMSASDKDKLDDTISTDTTVTRFRTRDLLKSFLLTASGNLAIYEVKSQESDSWTLEGYAAINSVNPKANTQIAANKVLATPNGSDGYPSMRSLVAADIPTLSAAKITGLGTIVEDSDSGVSAATATATNVSQITIDAGTWIVSYSVAFDSNATGRRNMRISTGSTTTSASTEYSVIVPAASGAQTILSKTVILVPTSSQTWYLNAMQNSGSSLNVSGVIRAVRIA